MSSSLTSLLWLSRKCTCADCSDLHQARRHVENVFIRHDDCGEEQQNIFAADEELVQALKGLHRKHLPELYVLRERRRKEDIVVSADRKETVLGDDEKEAVPSAVEWGTVQGGNGRGDDRVVVRLPRTWGDVGVPKDVKAWW